MSHSHFDFFQSSKRCITSTSFDGAVLVHVINEQEFAPELLRPQSFRLAQLELASLKLPARLFGSEGVNQVKALSDGALHRDAKAGLGLRVEVQVVPGQFDFLGKGCRSSDGRYKSEQIFSPGPVEPPFECVHFGQMKQNTKIYG